MSEPVRRLPIGIQSFEKLIEGNYIYIDKTEYIYRLVHNNAASFLSRPRRFGKSLLLSTIRAYWEGKKELFEGLKIETLEHGNPHAWQSYPVFYFDFNRDDYLTGLALEGILDAHLKDWEAIYGCKDASASYAVRFQNLLTSARAETGKRCVVLVDEYDKPLLDVLDHPDLEAHNKALFKGFFSSLKSFDDDLEFVLITGVTKFNKISIFSDLNQLEDISLDETYAELCGLTEAELVQEFAPEIEQLANAQSIQPEECLNKLRKTYDGYRFSSSADRKVYNPYSLLNALKKSKFGAYWFETGTPTFLVRKLRAQHFDVRRFTDQTIFATERQLSDYRADNPDLIPLLYQTGYLTITDHDQHDDFYTLGFPNEEVKYAILENLMPEYTSDIGTGAGNDILSLRRYFKAGDTDQIRDALISLFAGIPYTTGDVSFEHDFQSVLYIVFTLLGQYVHCEVRGYKGRADCIVETRQFVYLFEFKRDVSADQALQQIEDNGYALSYAADPRVLFKIGANFDSKERMLAEWKVISEES